MFASAGREALFEGARARTAGAGRRLAGPVRYDNLTAAVAQVRRSTRARAETGRRIAFRSHLGIERFHCRPGTNGAHEKGGAEGQTGHFRRNHVTSGARGRPDRPRRDHRDHEGDQRPFPARLKLFRPTDPHPKGFRVSTEAYVYDAIRTPRGRGKANGALHGTKPIDLVVGLIHELRDRFPGLDLAAIDDIVLGVVGPLGDQGSDIARIAAIAAGLPDTVAGVQENRFCASGLEAVNMAAAKVRSGFEDLVLAGGVESMSRVPMASDGGAWFNDPMTNLATNFVPQGIGADLIATIEGFSRRDVDEYAALSQERAATAVKENRFQRSVVPVRDRSGLVVLDHDEHLRPGTTADSLARLKPSFADIGELGGFDAVALQKYHWVEKIDHVHHAGNSSGVVDGASLVAIGTKEVGERYGLIPRARIVAAAVSGSEPTIMLTGPAPAARKALARAGMTIDDIDLVEINEAFAAVVLRFVRDMGLSLDKVNVNGGAIALGHPLGATGAMILGTLVDELERQDKRYGLATLCVGGGMGIATVVERV
ncbi:putative acyltransferase [Streptomyces jeddahensis]|uniref:Putative acyltransferase n=1 Tax=Streptomyces jeddahensis TaxID=1716141 RepID=A0A177HZF2_9ACTN|nr:putative acyltransferase [Streptomyces jeddahensis]